jgi:hypothetical protein
MENQCAELVLRKNDEAFEHNGCRQMVHGKKAMKGFVFVDEAGYKSKKDFDRWIKLCLDFNTIAKVAKKTLKNGVKKITLSPCNEG